MLLTAAGSISLDQSVNRVDKLLDWHSYTNVNKIIIFWDVYNVPEECVAPIFRVKQCKSAWLLGPEDGEMFFLKSCKYTSKILWLQFHLFIYSVYQATNRIIWHVNWNGQ